jgi:DNA-binding NtrC family response regulator
MQDKAMNGQSNGGSAVVDLKRLLEAYERGLILDALAASGGHQRRTAARLGILPTTLHEKMKRLGILKRRLVGEDAPSSNESAVRSDYAALALRSEGR